MEKKTKRRFREMLDLDSSPFSIAMGFAIGTFFAILPTFGLGILFGLLVLLFLKNVSKISMFISFVVWNPIVLIFIQPISYSIGSLIFPGKGDVNYSVEIFNQFFTHSQRYFTGSLIFSTFMAIVCFFIIYSFIVFSRKKKLIKS